MAKIQFPSSPSVDDTYTFGGITWKYNGSGWARYSVSGSTGATGDTGATGATGPVGDYVESFNGSTGAVTTNAMTLHVAGISSDGGATFDGNIVLQNNDYISNPSAYTIRMMPEGTSSTDYGLEFEFSDWGYGSVITSRRASDGSNAGNIRFDSDPTIGNDVDLNMGNNAGSRIRHTVTGNDTLQIGVRSNDATYSGALALIHSSYFAQSYRSPTTSHTNPNLYVYANSTDADEYIRFEHDATNANIVTGAGDISLQPASGVVGISGGISVNDNYNLPTGAGATGDVLMIANDGNLEFNSFKTTATFVVDSDVPLTTGVRYKGIYMVPLDKMAVTAIELRSDDASPAGVGNSLQVALKTIFKSTVLEAASPTIAGTVETVTISKGGEYHESVTEASVDSPDVGSNNGAGFLVVDVVSNDGNHTNFTMMVRLEARV